MGRKSWTIKELLHVTSEYLERKEIDSPRLCAEILLAHLLNIDRVRLYLDFDQPLQNGEISRYRSFIRRRLNREPLQHITGIQEFWSLAFTVGPQALIPRPETELLIEQVLSLSGEAKVPQSPRILDLGTGCGVLAICLAKELDRAIIWASDISGEALDLARRNARKHGVEDKISFIGGDLLQPVSDQSLRFDVIVSNPPYISSEALSSLPPEVGDHEPALALDGGEEGMFYIQRIIEEGPDHLNPGGWVLLEMDPEQTIKSFKLIEKTEAYQKKYRVKDYSHRYRVVVAQRS